jgi:formate hydrogenlyase transcriptional activator
LAATIVTTSSVQPGIHLETLRRITMQMTVARDVAEVLASITAALVEGGDVALARIWLVRSPKDCPTCRSARPAQPSTAPVPALHLTASAGLYSHIDGALHLIPIGQRKIGEIAATRRPLWSTDLEGEPRIPDKQWVRDQHLQCFAGYPLLFRDELVGVLGLFSRRQLTGDDFHAFEIFAAQAATAIKTAELFSRVERLKDRLLVENSYLQEEIRAEGGFEEIVGNSPSIRQVLHMVRLAAPTDACVLLLGESGTGKELIARAVHGLSPRRDRSMIRVNCGAIPATLVESEFFGHERGAFTGAVTRRIGRFELADKSTLFLDEIGDLPPEAQVKLLRVLQEGEFERLGGAQPMRVNVRPIAATNRDLTDDVANHRFREDLFYRLNVIPIRVPPLRERREDIPILVTHFLQRLQRKLSKPLSGVRKGTMDRLVAYSWPGNIRELENVLERASILSQGGVVEVDDALDNDGPGPDLTRSVATLEAAERAAIARALEATGGRIAGSRGAAALLDVNPSTLRSRMKQLGLSKGAPE